jgi:5'-nucleotidase/UDP-sugar diphosphatase
MSTARFPFRPRIKHVARHLALAATLGFAAASAQAFDLTVLHINDHHSHLKANKLDLTLAGKKTRVMAGGMPSVKSVINQLASQSENVLKLHAGDAITGDLYYTLFKGEADAALMNTICFDAFALGNHEFDDGDTGLVGFLDHLKKGECATPVLAANVVPEVGVSPLAKTSATDYFRPSVVLIRGGERIGIVGIDIVNKTVNSSNPDPTTKFLPELETAQKEIDKLRADGVNKIIALTHIQYQNDLKMAAKLSGVDIIVGGDSHSLLGSGFKTVGLSPEGEYPSVVKNTDGDQVCVVQAWEYSNIVGELKVSFDSDGRVTSCGGTPHLLLADSFKRRNADRKRVELEGDIRAAVIAEVQANPLLRMASADADAATLLAGYSERVDVLKKIKLGTAAETLCLERIPGQGRSKACDKAATMARGADITNIVAKGFLRMAKAADIAIQNGGGVRVDILEGDVSIGDAYTLMPFANTLVELSMTGAEVKAVLEDAFDYAISEGGSTGAYPYASGLRFDVDRSRPKGERFSKLEVNARLQGSWAAMDMNQTYAVVTNSYIARGKDGYATFKTVSDRGDTVDTYLDYAQSFADYVRAVGEVTKLPVEEYSTQSYTNESGVKQ